MEGEYFDPLVAAFKKIGVLAIAAVMEASSKLQDAFGSVGKAFAQRDRDAALHRDASVGSASVSSAAAADGGATSSVGLDAHLSGGCDDAEKAAKAKLELLAKADQKINDRQFSPCRCQHKQN